MNPQLHLARPCAAFVIAIAALPGTAAAESAQLMNGHPTDRLGFYAAIGLAPDQIETFELVPMGHDVSVPSFTQNGVTYTALTGSPLVVASAGCCSQFAANLLPTLSAVLTGNGHDDMRVDFAAPVLAVTFDVYTNGEGLAEAKFYDGALFLGSASWNGRAEIRSWGFWNDSHRISHFTFTDTLGETVNAGIDNLDWVSAPVPEPGTWALMLAGLGLAGALARRRC